MSGLGISDAKRAVSLYVLPVGSLRGQFVRRLLRSSSYDPFWVRMERFRRRNPNAIFVQIGAHDGAEGDLLCSFIDRSSGWRGVMVEPVPAMFEALVRHRGSDPRLRLVNTAITDHDGTTTMTCVEPMEPIEGVPDMSSQLSSIHEDVVMRHAPWNTNLAERLHRIEVPAMTIATLVGGLERIDLLAIDTEGHDAVILDSFELGRWLPEMIVFERKHLDKAVLARCVQRLEQHGYEVRRIDADCVARRRGARRATHRRPGHG